MRKLSITVITLAIVLMSGCGGHEPNPIATHQIGDDNRTCESLKLEIAQNEVLITKKLKKDESKFWTNTRMVFSSYTCNGPQRSRKD